MKKSGLTLTQILFVSFFILFSCSQNETDTDSKENVKILKEYSQLESLFKDWREFESPPLFKGAPDYRKGTFEERHPEFTRLQNTLLAMDTSGWTSEQKVDWYIVWAEMNGYDFNNRILKPWERDPAFYQSVFTYRSDVPAHEGPTHHMTTELWTYLFPLEDQEKERLLNDLKVIPPLNDQAKINLTGNARELWIAGIRDIENQSKNLEALKEKEGISDSQEIMSAIEDAIASTNGLVEWLKNEAVKKDGPSGIGKENYTWYLQNVHLVPLTWEDEVMILKRELARAWSTLKLEEHRNRELEEIAEANEEDEYNKLADESVKSIIEFLKNDEIVTVKDYFEPALEAHKGSFVPKEDRHFFYIGSHYDPRPLYSHFYHWFELARMDTEPHKSVIRRGPLLYNIFDSRNEGTATAVEEMFMHAGLYDDSPRTREIVYIMLAQRAARGLGSLYAHANEMTMEEAGGIHSKYTPRGWVKTDEQLLLFEQQLYMRQPGYGTSYVTGKYLLESAMADFAKMKEENTEEFRVKEFFDRLNSAGNIPVSLSHWQMTGSDNHLSLIFN